MSLIQVVPHDPVSSEGVGSYALALGAALARNGESASRYLAAAALPAQSARALAAALAGESTVLLHYANYGYQRRGCPAWLIDGLGRWKGEDTGRRLVTVFHEVHASGPPWRSSYWLRPRQRQLAARLLRLTDATVTSLERYAGVLRGWRAEPAIVVSPVFSTVGEPEAVPPLADRPRRLLVFGGPGARGRAWGELRNELLATCRALELEEVWDVGAPAGAPARLDGLRVRELGVLPAGETSARLLEGFAGFLAYPSSFLGKSTTFAAYCAHGLLPVCAWREVRSLHTAKDTPPHWGTRGPAPADPQLLATAAQAWYAEHSLARQVETFGELLKG
ncbi:MAG TPA: glycosyltransferase family 1 protein [Thermoanaerobaculia bacterium]|nr:glycosyltransferase family 1 protein [Thermoanaerobaculia bacterium]